MSNVNNWKEGRKRNRQLLLLLNFFSLITSTFSQTEALDIYATFQPASAVTHSRGVAALFINPANFAIPTQIDTLQSPSPLYPAQTEILPWIKARFLQFNAALFSSSLKRSEITSLLLERIETPMSDEEKQRLVNAFDNSALGFATNFLYFGAWMQLAPHTALGFGIRERITSYLAFNRFTAELMFYGRKHPYFDSVSVIDGDTVGFARNPRKFSELFSGTQILFSWLREYTLGFGTQILSSSEFLLSFGFNAKYIAGYSYLEGKTDNKKLVAISAMNPAFNIDYGKAISPSFIDTTSFIPIGWGLGADLGLSVHLPQFQIGISLLDLGFISWEGNLYQALDTILNGLSSTGFQTLDLFQEVRRISGKGGFFKWEGLWRVHRVLPTRLYVGASLLAPDKLQEYRIHTISFLLGIPFNHAAGNLIHPLIATGIILPLAHWVTLYPAVLIGGSLPRPALSLFTSFELFKGFLQINIGTDDLITFFVNPYPVVSANLSILNFSLPKLW